MNRKYHNQTLQTNPRHRDEEPQNIYNNKTSERQQKQSNQLSLPRQDDCKTRMDIKQRKPNKDQNSFPQTMGGT